MESSRRAAAGRRAGAAVAGGPARGSPSAGEALRRICETTEIRAADVDAVSTFFPHFRRTPPGSTRCRVRRHACPSRGRTRCTTPSGTRWAPAGKRHGRRPPLHGAEGALPRLLHPGAAVQIDHVTYATSPAKARPPCCGLPREGGGRRGRARRGAPRAPDGAPEIRVGLGRAALAGGSARVRDAVEDTVRRHGLSANLKAVTAWACAPRPPASDCDAGDPVITYAKCPRTTWRRCC
jgi:hypothetical protein